jgi:ABC-type phosphate/phosphonate transport system permease subunit
MTKKDLFIGGWVGIGQLLVAARQTVQCSSVLIIVYLLLNTNVELTNTYGSRVRCGSNTTNTEQLFYLLLVILIINFGIHILPW